MKLRTTTLDDLDTLHALYMAALGNDWPLTQEQIGRVLGAQMQRAQLQRADGRQLIAEVDGEAVGFLAAPIVNGKGFLSLLSVHPDFQRRGIGTQLHNAAVEHFQSKGITEVHAGMGSPGFWQGVPCNQPGAAAFFEKLGYQMGGRSIDMVQNLHGYKMPSEIASRKGLENIELRAVRHSEIAEMLDFVQRQFPGWHGVYKGIAELGDLQDLIIGRENGGPILACIVIYSPDSHLSRTDVLWTEILGTDAGAFGAVGVDESQRGRGLGLLLVGVASEMLAARGVGNCFVHWTHLEGFYAKAGYAKWREYFMPVKHI